MRRTTTGALVSNGDDTNRRGARPAAGIASLLAALAGCGGGDGSGAGGPSGSTQADGGGSTTGAKVAGTVSLPVAVTARCAMVALDNDTSGSNGAAPGANGRELIEVHSVTGTTVSFAFDAVPAGNYFLWGYVDADGSVSAPPQCDITGGPNTGDHLGYYATGLAEPGAPNVGVPHADGVTFDFQIGVFP